MATSQESSSIHSASLEPVLSDYWVFTWRETLVSLLFVVVFLVFCYLPLSIHTTGVHVYQGAMQWNQGDWFPETDYTQPLAANMPYFETSWLSNLLLYFLAGKFSGEPLSWVMATCTVACAIGVASISWNRSKNHWITIASVIGFVSIAWNHIGFAQPAMFGMVLFTAILFLTQNLYFDSIQSQIKTISIWQLVSVALCMILWVNLDATVILGTIFLLCLACGALIDQLIEDQFNLSKTLANKRTQQSIYLANIGVFALLCSPLALNYFHLVITTQNYGICSTLGGYLPLVLASWIGIAFAVSLICYGILVKLSPARVSSAELITLLVFGILVAINQTLIVWFALLVTMALVKHLAAIIQVSTAKESYSSNLHTDQEKKPLRFAYTMVCVLLVWIGFALSPISAHVLGGKTRTMAQIYELKAPMIATKYLHKYPTDQLVFAPADWADWFVFTAPKNTQLFATSRQHLLPEQTRFDYGVIAGGNLKWEEVADRYGVRTIIIDRNRQRGLVAAAKSASENWTVVLEEDSTLIITRRPN